MQEHNLFKPKDFEDGRNQVVGNCNGFMMQERWEKETPAFAKKIMEYIAVPTGISKILDYGCGVGRIAKAILDLPVNMNLSIIGIDSSQTMLDRAACYVDNKKFTILKPEQLLAEDKFDLAYCVYVLQHAPAIEIREILSRIYNHLKDDGIFIYCSSDYRMAIRYDGKGFFDDRFLGVDLQAEVERFFDKVEPLFNEEDFKNNPVLKKMITGCDNGLAHPAFVYKKKLEKKNYAGHSVIEVEIGDRKAKAIQDSPVTLKTDLKAQKLLLINRLSPGDILVMTNAIRDLHKAYPGIFITDVRTPCPAIFENNPYITKLSYDENEYNKINSWFQSNVGKTMILGDICCIDMQYPLIHSSGARGAHFAEGHREFLEETLKIKIPQTKIRPELYLSNAEMSEKRPVEGKYWVINAGSKNDYTLKQYPYYQEVVDLLKDKIQFVQIGVKSHLHKPLDGVIDMVGKTDNLRDLFKLIYHAEGVLTCVSLPMHVAAAFKRPCVVVAGAREGTRWELYPNHRFIYVNGCLPCAAYDGCWRSKYEDCNVKKDGIPLCMSLIKPEEVAKEIERYYEGRFLKYDVKRPVILNQKGKNMPIPTVKELANATVTPKKPVEKKNKEIAYTPFPVGVNSVQVTSAIFNILRILKQLTPQDTYLEAYQWHYDKRKDKFMDVYHFMNWLGANVRPRRILEIGTRTGISICQLLSAYLNYNDLEKVILCDLFNDGLATPGVVLNALKYLGIPIGNVQFIMGNSLEEIPKLNDTFDYILVDGGHEKETAKQDLANAVKLIEPAGYILFDDITPDGCSLQDVWDQFKQNNFADFTFMESSDGKGVGVARKIS